MTASPTAARRRFRRPPACRLMSNARGRGASGPWVNSRTALQDHLSTVDPAAERRPRPPALQLPNLAV